MNFHYRPFYYLVINYFTDLITVLSPAVFCVCVEPDFKLDFDFGFRFQSKEYLAPSWKPIPVLPPFLITNWK